MAKATSSNASSSTPGASRWQGFLIFGVFALGGLLFIGLAGFGWLASNANVYGIAMSPETFEFRKFHYYVNPFSGERMWGTNQKGTQQPLGAKRHLDKLTEDKQHWVVIRKSEYGTQIDYPGVILYEHLTGQGFSWQWNGVENTFYPEDGELGSWLDSHDDHGAVFWPLVQQLTRLEYFAVVPDLFVEIERYREEGNKNHDKKAFEKRLRRNVSNGLVAIATFRISKNRTEEALDVLDDAITFDPTNPNAFRRRAEALRKAERPDEAKRDEKEASSLGEE